MTCCHRSVIQFLRGGWKCGKSNGNEISNPPTIHRGSRNSNNKSAADKGTVQRLGAGRLSRFNKFTMESGTKQGGYPWSRSRSTMTTTAWKAMPTGNNKHFPGKCPTLTSVEEQIDSLITHNRSGPGAGWVAEKQQSSSRSSSSKNKCTSAYRQGTGQEVPKKG